VDKNKKKPATATAAGKKCNTYEKTAPLQSVMVDQYVSWLTITSWFSEAKIMDSFLICKPSREKALSFRETHIFREERVVTNQDTFCGVLLNRNLLFRHASAEMFYIAHH